MGDVTTFRAKPGSPRKRKVIASRHRHQRRELTNDFHLSHLRQSALFSALRRFYGVATLLVFAGVAAWHHGLPQQATEISERLSLFSPYVPSFMRPGGDTSLRRPTPVVAGEGYAFPLCGAQPRVNCVVDGDTFWRNGEKIRISDINAPETWKTGAAGEARRGREATLRLQQHLNSGKIELRRGNRDKDRYGRSLRTVYVNGRPVGESMVREGYARRWR